MNFCRKRAEVGHYLMKFPAEVKLFHPIFRPLWTIYT